MSPFPERNEAPGSERTSPVKLSPRPMRMLALARGVVPLTDREREIALLAAALGQGEP
jgi:hypothetical protein